jgi:hypothetical protein
VHGLIRLLGPLLAASLCGPSRAEAQSSTAPGPTPETTPPPVAAPAPLRPAADPSRGARPRLAISEFALEGDGQSPALGMQLRDGLLIGLVREGIDVIDSTDVTKQLATARELEGCETSPCLKRLGELLAVRYLIRVKIGLAGNSYRMTVRLFSTEGAAPAALPLAALSRACDVCTVNEAREHMIRLAEGVRVQLDQSAAPPPSAPPPAPLPPRSRKPAFVLLAAGIAAIMGGAVLVASGPEMGKRRPAFGGAVIGLGFSSSVIGLYSAFGPTSLRSLAAR